MDAQPVKKNTSAESLPEKRKKGMIACLVISVIVIALYFVPYGRYVLYPFMLIYTFIHEMGHGIMAALLGGHFVKFEMWLDGSGMATSSLSNDASRLTKALVAFGGLIAPAIMAAVCMVLGRNGLASRIGLYIFTVICAVSVIVLVPFTNPFGMVFILGCGVLAALLATIPKSHDVPQYSMLLLAITLLTAVFSRGDYLFTDVAQTAVGLAPSDVGQIANNLLLPYWFWGGLIAALSVIILILGIRGFFYTKPKAVKEEK